jgi:hypothetical protein
MAQFLSIMATTNNGAALTLDWGSMDTIVRTSGNGFTHVNWMPVRYSLIQSRTVRRRTTDLPDVEGYFRWDAAL